MRRSRAARATSARGAASLRRGRVAGALTRRTLPPQTGSGDRSGVDRLSRVSAQEQPLEQQRSLYRRHRPRSFAEIVGQEAVVRTLANALQRGKVHHAYLFVGSRGTGKTPMAKIHPACLKRERGPTVQPC